MSVFLGVSATILHCLFIIAAERPNFRLDYKYEKAFDAFYKLHRSATTWAEARMRCQSEGAELLVPDSLDEADSAPLLMTSILTRFEGIFVGIHDLYSERSFVTLRGGEMLVSILNLLWERQQPMPNAGRCVGMRRTGRLFVHPCHQPLPFMCKVSNEDITYYNECNSFNPEWKLGFNKTCYFMSIEPQNWYQAYTTCVSAGGYLAIINNQTEADHIKSLFKLAEPKRIPENDFAYLGFSDLFTQHHYRTVHGEPVENLQYKDWTQQSCTNSNMSQADLRCGGLRRTGLLATWDCTVPAMFFCEKIATDPPIRTAMPIGTTEKVVKTTTAPATSEVEESPEVGRYGR